MIRSLNGVLPMEVPLVFYRFYLVTFLDTTTKPCFMNEHTKELFSLVKDVTHKHNSKDLSRLR